MPDTSPEVQPAGAKPLTDDERDRLRKQFVDAYAHAQESFDSSIRTLAAAGVGVTVTLAAALEQFGTAGALAVLLFLVSLGCNLVSFATAQRDISRRLIAVRALDRAGAFGNRWSTLTFILNVGAAVALIAGGACLSYFVASTV